jgi:cation:H+ antiporter
MVMWVFGAGLVLLALGGEGLIRGGVMIKRALGVSPVIVGLFVLSIGTSSPGLAVAIEASRGGLADLSVGTLIGTTLINLLLILGLGALIRPMQSPPKVVLRDGTALLLASGALVGLSLAGTIDRRLGAALLGAFLLYAVVAIVSDWRRSPEHSVHCAEAERRAIGERPSFGGGLFVLIVGVICLILGAHFLAGGAVGLSTLLNVSLANVALSAVALAASLPVLAATAIAAARGHTQIAIGHLITASVFNLFGALGIAALVHPLQVPKAFAAADVFVILAASVLLIPLLSTHWRLSRLKGAALVLAYIGYIGFLAWRQGLIPHGIA